MLLKLMQRCGILLVLITTTEMWVPNDMKNILPMENIFTSGHRTVTSAICVTLKYAVDVKNRM